MHRSCAFLFLLLFWVPSQGQVPFIQALTQDTSMNLSRPRVLARIAPDLYRVVGGSGNGDSAWYYCADIEANGLLTNMRTMRCGVNTTNAAPSCMLRTSDQGMLVAFAQPDPGTNSYSFAKLDVNNNVQWYRNYFDVYGQWMVDSQHALAEKDGHYFTFGRMTTVPTTEGHASIMVELDGTGVCVAQRIWAGGDMWSGEGAGIVRTADNGLLTVATEHIYSGVSSFPTMSVQRWDAALQVAWSNRYSFGYYHSVVRLMATADGGALLMGKARATLGSQAYPFFLRLDGAGQILWARLVLNSDLVPTGMVEEPDGGFAICLYDDPPAPIVARLDSTGALVSAQRASSLSEPVHPWLISLDSITGEHLVGATTAAYEPTTYFMRLDAALSFACGSTPYLWADSIVSPTVTAFPVTVTPAWLSSADTAWASHDTPVFGATDACLSTAVREEEPEALRVWPIPAQDVLHVAWYGSGSPPITYSLIDPTGRTMMQGPVGRDGEGLWIDVHDLGFGTYLLRLETAQGRRTVRVIK
ncbi:MAG TPA: T9SS type A sorting domain-containing protein [Flavobacteriales bacterium]|nr:T9SS type A sorting domain-containing protein [Flavobacteriales bacterium]